MRWTVLLAFKQTRSRAWWDWEVRDWTGLLDRGEAKTAAIASQEIASALVKVIGEETSDR